MRFGAFTSCNLLTPFQGFPRLVGTAPFEHFWVGSARFASLIEICYHQVTMLTANQKAKVIAGTALHDKDTGSPEAQVAVFSGEIERLAKHLKKHLKDNSSRRGLLKMVAKRKRLLDYLKKEDPTRHAKLVKHLGLRA